MRHHVFGLGVLGLLCGVAYSQTEGVTEVLDIGSRLELFVDDYLIESTTGLRPELHHPVPQEVAIPFDAPWEGPTSIYVTVFQDDDRCRAYYRGSGHEGVERPEVTAYAESPDGITWTKPKLGLYEWGGTKENNIVRMGPGSHNFAPFKDANPDCKPEERYKAVAGGPLIALASPDGLRWAPMQAEPIITEGAFDSQNLAFWGTVAKQYVCYLRDFRDGVRTIRRATSADFLHWTSPECLDFGDAPREHLYTNAITPYFRAPHLCFGFPGRFVPERKAVPEHPDPGISDGVFMCSRDGLHFRRYLEGFLRPGLDRRNWTDRNNHLSYGLIPTSPEEISLYWTENYRHDTCHLRRGTLRTDGFVSISADYSGGELTTKPLTFEGKQLVINYSTSAVGSVRVELQDASGQPLPGFTLADCPEIYGDEIEHVVTWSSGTDLSALAGKVAKVRFVMRDGDLYSLRFRR